jgi:hypothetical protein
MFVDVHIVKVYITVYVMVCYMVYITVYTMVYTVIYTMQYTMIYKVIYTFIYTESYLDSLLNRHSWDITRYWYLKITEQCSDISSFKSRQVVTKFSGHGIPHHSTLSAAYTASWRCIIVVIPVPIAPICPILLCNTVPLSSGMAENTNLLACVA